MIDPVRKERIQMNFQSHRIVMLWDSLRPYLIIFQTTPRMYVVA